MRARPPPHVAQHEGIRLGHKLGHEYEGLDMQGVLAGHLLAQALGFDAIPGDHATGAEIGAALFQARSPSAARRPAVGTPSASQPRSA